MSSRWLLLLPALATACVAPDDVSDESAALSDGTPEAFGVLAFLNGPDATLDRLDNEIGLDARAARNIVSYESTRKLRTIAELDAISYVGPVAIDKLLDYVEAHGGVPDQVVEGVGFTAAQATAVLAASNGATVAELDAVLDVRAAKAIVAGRPIADLDHLAALSYVGANALQKLIVLGATWHGTTPCDLAFAPRGDAGAQDWNDLMEWGTFGDYGPGGNLITYQATCVDAATARGQDEIVAAVRAVLQGQWMAAEVDVGHSAVTTGGAQFVGAIQTMRDMLDSHVEGGWNPNATPESAAVWAQVDALEHGLIGAAQATPADFAGISFNTYAEECSEHGTALIQLSTGKVWVSHIAPRC